MKTLCKKRLKVNGKTPSPVLRISLELLRGRGSRDNFGCCHLPASWHYPSSSLLLDSLASKTAMAPFHMTSLNFSKRRGGKSEYRPFP